MAMAMATDFKAISDAALVRFDSVMDWLGLGGGKHAGQEYLPTNPTRQDHKPGSFSINMDTGKWAEFAGDGKESGGDLISLVAYIRRCTQGEAARELAAFLGMSDATPKSATAHRPPPKPAERSADAGNWQCCIPIPADAPPAPQAHGKHGRPERRYTYTTADGKPAFFIDRYATPDGKVFSQLTAWRNTAGKVEWQWKAPPPPRPLYGLHDLATRPDAPVIVCEGEKATEAARALFPAFVVVCWPGGANAVEKSDFTHLAGRDVTLWPDIDAPGKAAMAKVSAILADMKPPATALRMVKPKFFGLSSQGDDAADVTGWNAERCAKECERGDWREAIDTAKKEATPPKRRPRAARPHGGGRFRLEPDGVYFIEGGNDGTEAAKFVCAPLEILGVCRDSDSRQWGLYVRFCDPDNNEHTLTLHKRLFLGEGHDVLRTLQDEGLRIGAGKPTKARLIEYLETANPAARIRIATKTGWNRTNGERVFVLPDAAYGAGNEVWRYESGEPAVNPFDVKGTATEWREHVASLCRGNSRLIFAVSVAFAAPLIEITRRESGGFHFRGDSSSGKTTVLRVAASVCGGRSYLEQWRATDNALESLAMQHCDASLMLDELAMLDARTAGDVAYMLANGGAKARATRTGGTRSREQWRTLYLSSGEIALSQHVAEGGKTTRAGQELRLANIPADAGAGLGAWEDIHGCANGAEFSNKLTAAAGKYHGAVFRAFIERLTQTPDDDVSRQADAMRKKMTDAHLTEAASGQAIRVADRFALVATAGELATEWGLTGWQPGDAERAASICFAAWLEAWGGEENHEHAAMLQQVREFLERFGESAFTPWQRLRDIHAPRTVDRAGVVRWLTRDGEPIEKDDAASEEFRKAGEFTAEYLVFPQAWKSRVCKGYDPKAVAQLMAERGFLIHDGDGHHLTHRIRLPGTDIARVYHIKSTFLQSDDTPQRKPPACGFDRACRDCIEECDSRTEPQHGKSPRMA